MLNKMLIMVLIGLATTGCSVNKQQADFTKSPCACNQIEWKDKHNA